ncbi:hypothetical protein HQO27_14345 [Rhodococcus fascians]|nr:hypothetical protein [Rhodococcus fascians]MBY4431951.1 hypothetical protein [Rhodococcus fascians]
MGTDTNTGDPSKTYIERSISDIIPWSTAAKRRAIASPDSGTAYVTNGEAASVGALITAAEPCTGTACATTYLFDGLRYVTTVEHVPYLTAGRAADRYGSRIDKSGVANDRYRTVEMS